MSRSIAIVLAGPGDRARAVVLARHLSRRVVEGPTPHNDEVVLVAPQDRDRLDTAMACVVAPDLGTAEDVRPLLDWAMEQRDVLTPWEHEQVMP